MAESIPLKPIAWQQLQVQLGDQACTLAIYQLDFGLFAEVYVDNLPIITGVICEDRNRIVRDPYLGFIGDLAFIDLEGTTDPVYTGLGTRYQLLYLEA